MNLEEAIQLEKQLHPFSTRQDLYKLIVQSCLGNGHLITSPEDSFQALQKEKSIAGKDSLQEIGNGFIRVPLSYMKEEDLLLWNELFIESAKKRSTRRIFDQALQNYGFVDEGIVSHSREYKEHYDPHYRVFRKEYVDYFEVFKVALHALQEHRVISIDGPCASGKTTIGKLLSSFLECPCIHMDDYFLQAYQRTAQRLEEPGGNIDYERFHQEINEAWNQKQPIHMRSYDCSSQTLRREVIVEKSPILIIEGSYAHHPYLDDMQAFKIFMDIKPSIQKERLQKRSPDKFVDFIEKWIPMEEKYFHAFSIKEKSDYVFSR
ncbi:uridine kinase family protein [Faecalicoccus pleomorphus]|uniref:uridine kinase family protein n=1 Tax=Faecalicoccus pleomorphus TaxID=1323 RepID=UPI0022E43860|nr:AAA family ATPase [Faecalicoccus pleomorphus]